MYASLNVHFEDKPHRQERGFDNFWLHTCLRSPLVPMWHQKSTAYFQTRGSENLSKHCFKPTYYTG